MYLRNLLILSALLFVTACARKQQAVTTPWGETIGDEEGDTAVVAADNGTLCVRRREKAAAAALGDVGAQKA